MKAVDVALAVEVEMVKIGAVFEESAASDSCAHGEVVPKPRYPLELKTSFVELAIFRSRRLPVKPETASKPSRVVVVSLPARESLAQGEVVPTPRLVPVNTKPPLCSSAVAPVLV